MLRATAGFNPATPGAIGGTTAAAMTCTTLNTTSGQIQFPATQNASANANTLDDYEEGTFTPAFTGLTVVNGTGGATYAGTYTKTGRKVSWSATITVTGTCTTASTAGTTFHTLPFSVVTEGATGAVNRGSVASYGNGLVTGSVHYCPTWSAVNNAIVLSGTYFV